MKIQRATVTVAPDILRAIYKIPSALISQHGSGQHLPGDWRRQSRLWSEFPSLILLLMIVYTAVVQRVGFYSSACPRLPVSVCSASSVSHTRHRGILLSAHVCERTHTLL